MISLNEEQRAAVEHRMDWVALCSSGAGSGKTRVLQARVEYLVGQGITPKKILVCTFTNKAAGELKHRLGYDPADTEGPRVSTMHGLALSAIKKNPKGFGYSDKLSILDSYGQGQMLKDILNRAHLNEEIKYYDLIDKIEYHRSRGLGFANEYTEAVHKATKAIHSGLHLLSPKELDMWKEYELEKNRQSNLDFSDMIHMLVRRGREDDLFKSRIQKQFQHVLVDEIQDLSSVQHWLIDLLMAPDNRNLYMVGDISQSIYSFTGAVPKTLYDYSKSWRGIQPDIYKLESNHRSVPEVVKLANVIQKQMSETIPLRMKSHRGVVGDKGSVILMEAENPRQIAAKIVDQIWYKNQQLYNKVPYSGNCILVRSATQIRDIESELVRARIPYVVRGGQSLLQSEEARDLISYLRFLTNPRDLVAMSRAIGIPKRGVGEATLNKIRDISVAKDCDLIEAMERYAHPKTALFLEEIKDMLLMMARPVELYDRVVRCVKYEKIIEEKYKKDKDKIEWKKINLGRIREVIEGLAATNMTLSDIVFQMSMNDKDEEDSKDLLKDGKVTISTIHSSKGLEWHSIWLTNVIEGSLPHMYCLLPEEVEEERRLLYVAVTRARDFLAICIPANKMRGDQYIQATPSRFLYEIKVLS